MRLILLLGVVLLAAVLAFPFVAPRFLVRTVEIRGFVQLSPDEIRHAAGLDEQVYIWQVDPAGVEARLRQLPRIYSAAAHRAWPDRVVIDVRERVPVALVVYHNRYYLEIDGNAFVTAIYDALPQEPLPLVTGLDLSTQLVGRPVPGEVASAAAQFCAALSAQGRARLSEIHATPGGLTAYLLHGVPIRLGSPTSGQWASKAQALDTLLRHFAETGQAPREIDLRFPERPVVRTS